MHGHTCQPISIILTLLLLGMVITNTIPSAQAYRLIAWNTLPSVLMVNPPLDNADLTQCVKDTTGISTIVSLTVGALHTLMQVAQKSFLETRTAMQNLEQQLRTLLHQQAELAQHLNNLDELTNIQYNDQPRATVEVLTQQEAIEQMEQKITKLQSKIQELHREAQLETADSIRLQAMGQLLTKLTRQLNEMHETLQSLLQKHPNGSRLKLYEQLRQGFSKQLQEITPQVKNVSSMLKDTELIAAVAAQRMVVISAVARSLGIGAVFVLLGSILYCTTQYGPQSLENVDGDAAQIRSEDPDITTAFLDEEDALPDEKNFTEVNSPEDSKWLAATGLTDGSSDEGSDDALSNWSDDA